ncbi:MAG: hypothetical protein QOJ09_2706, partial [Actinomycetota bacterium]|nr:hypothetical protein [Actinomycetota bacterium]
MALLALLAGAVVAATSAGRAAERGGDSPVHEAVRVEQPGELMRVFGSLEQRFGEGRPGDYRAALDQRLHLAAASSNA